MTVCFVRSAAVPQPVTLRMQGGTLPTFAAPAPMAGVGAMRWLRKAGVRRSEIHCDREFLMINWASGRSGCGRKRRIQTQLGAVFEPQVSIDPQDS